MKTAKEIITEIYKRSLSHEPDVDKIVVTNGTVFYLKEVLEAMEEYASQFIGAKELSLLAERDEKIETLRMQLTACGVAAMSNTTESIESNGIAKDNPFWSASYQDVCNAVQREMAHRKEVEQTKSELEAVKRERDEMDEILHGNKYYELKSQAEKKVDFGTQTFRNVQTASKVELILKPEHMNTVFTWKQIQDAIIADNPTTN